LSFGALLCLVLDAANGLCRPGIIAALSAAGFAFTLFLVRAQLSLFLKLRRGRLDRMRMTTDSYSFRVCMTNPRKLTAYALAATLLLGSGGAVFAQTSSGGNTGGGVVTSSDQSRTTEGNGSTMNRAGADDSHFDWGWLGLLGLIGPTGLMARSCARQIFSNRNGRYR
jgi:hypothetical protein